MLSILWHTCCIFDFFQVHFRQLWPIGCEGCTVSGRFGQMNLCENLVSYFLAGQGIKWFPDVRLTYDIQQSCRGKFHQHVSFQILHVQFPKVQKDCHIISVFICFWDLCKLLVKRWYKCPQFPSEKGVQSMFVELNAWSVKNVMNPAKKCQAMTKEIAFLSKSCCQELKRRDLLRTWN